MIKGVNKSIIEVPNINNKYFEKAILFVRPEYVNADNRYLRLQANKYIQTFNVPQDFFNNKKRRVLNTRRILICAALIGISIALYMIFK